MNRLLIIISCAMLATQFATAASATPLPASTGSARADTVMASEFNQILVDALEGNAQSQYIVGYRYYYGRGIEADPSQAVAFLTRAANQGHQAAAELLKQAETDDGLLLDSTAGNGAADADVHISAEVMPCFPGGLDELVRFLSSNIQYPLIAQEREIEGRVVLQLVVDKTGKVGDVKVVQPVDELLDQEAVRVCKLLPDFVPGVVDGKAAAVWYTLPIVFKLTD